MIANSTNQSNDSDVSSVCILPHGAAVVRWKDQEETYHFVDSMEEPAILTEEEISRVDQTFYSSPEFPKLEELEKILPNGISLKKA